MSIRLHVRRLRSIPPQSPTGGKYMIYLVRVMLLVGLHMIAAIRDPRHRRSKSNDERLVPTFPLHNIIEVKIPNLWTLWLGVVVTSDLIWEKLSTVHQDWQPALMHRASAPCSVLMISSTFQRRMREGKFYTDLSKLICELSSTSVKNSKLKAVNCWDVSPHTTPGGDEGLSEWKIWAQMVSK